MTTAVLPTACAFPPGTTLPPPSAPSALRYLREYRRLGVGTANGAFPPPPSLLPELLRVVQQGRTGTASESDDGSCCCGARTGGASMMDLIGHALSAEERGCSAAAAVAAGGVDITSGDSSSSRKEASVPPWLLMAMVSAAQDRGPVGAPGAGSRTGAPSSFGGGDPATAAAQVGLRNALERRVAESLRSLDSVRALLQDPARSAGQGAAADGAGSALRSGADDGALGRLAALAADVDPATALFEGTLREWLACRRRRGKEGGELRSRRRPREGSSLGGGMRGSGFGRGEEGGLRTVPDDALALAFRCEVAGDAEAMVSATIRGLVEI